VLGAGRSEEELRFAWGLGDAVESIDATAGLLEWAPELHYCCGYTIDYDGVPIPYRQHLQPVTWTLRGSGSCTSSADF
jgi:hypothetical protein